MKVKLVVFLGLCLLLLGCGSSGNSTVKITQSVIATLKAMESMVPHPTPKSIPQTVNVSWEDGSSQVITGNLGPDNSLVFDFTGKGEQVELTSSWGTGFATVNLDFNGTDLSKECDPNQMELVLPGSAVPSGSSNILTISLGC